MRFYFENFRRGFTLNLKKGGGFACCRKVAEVAAYAAFSTASRLQAKPPRLSKFWAKPKEKIQNFGVSLTAKLIANFSSYKIFVS